VVNIANGNPAGTNTVTIGSVTATNNDYQGGAKNGATKLCNCRLFPAGFIGIGTSAYFQKRSISAPIGSTIGVWMLKIATTSDATIQQVTIGYFPWLMPLTPSPFRAVPYAYVLSSWL